jgi:ParB family chromosome partitioning protein
MTKSQTKTKARAPAERARIQVPLCDLGLAPENLRFDEPEDAEVPRLAETIDAAGVIYPPLVRKGRKGEQPFMVLDGRRRRFALLRLAADGKLADDAPIDCLLAVDRAGQAQAAVLPNAEVSPAHQADIIAAIGKLRVSKMGTRAIADALGYDELDVKRLEVLAGVHPDVLQAFKAGRINQRQVRMFTRIKDQGRQAELAEMALRGHFNEHLVHSAGISGRVTRDDPRFAVITEADYATAGGRISADLFGELPDEVLDADVLDDLWRARAAVLAGPLTDAGVEVSVSRTRSFESPEGLMNLPWIHDAGLSDARRIEVSALRDRIDSAEEAVMAAEPEGVEAATGELLLAQLELAKFAAGRGEVVAALIVPDESGVDVTFYQRPAPPEPVVESEAEDEDESERVDGDEDAEVEIEAVTPRPVHRPDIEVPAVTLALAGVTHVQHAAHTDIATRGLIRDLADKPEAAIIVLTAHLFAQLCLQGVGGLTLAVLQIEPSGSGDDGQPDDGLAGSVWARLDAQREVYLASGLRPIPWVTGLPPADRLDLLANLVAVTVDLREWRTDLIRRAARAEAAEVAALCDANLSRRWTPDAAFLDLHTQPQLQDYLKDMGAEVPKDAKRKAALVQVTVEAAASRRWIPQDLRWTVPEPSEPEAEAATVEPAPEAEAEVEAEAQALPEVTAEAA